MKKLLTIVLLFAAFQVFGQKQIDQDSTSVDAAYSAYKRVGTKLLGRAESGLWRLARADSSGNLYVTEPYYDPVDMADTTITISTAWDTIPLGKVYEKFLIYNTHATTIARIGFSADPTYQMLWPANIGNTWSIATDTLVVRGDAAGTLIINMVNRKRY